MARMMRENFRRRGPCHPWCEPMELVKGRALERREWRREWSDELDFLDAVDKLLVPGWCPITWLECPDWCSHTGVAC